MEYETFKEELKDNLKELSCQNTDPMYQYAIYDVLDLIEEME